MRQGKAAKAPAAPARALRGCGGAPVPLSLFLYARLRLAKRKSPPPQGRRGIEARAWKHLYRPGLSKPGAVPSLARIASMIEKSTQSESGTLGTSLKSGVA
ncbi:hypothetical protein BH10PSE9_BH10PSE9_04210 [soil metagenome]